MGLPWCKQRLSHREDHLDQGLCSSSRVWWKTLPSVATGVDPGFSAQECTNKTLTTGPFGNTCKANEVSPEVEAGVVARLRCKVAREVVGGPRGPIVIIVEVIQCKVD